MDSLFSRFVLCASLVSAISSPGALHGRRRNRQCFRSSLFNEALTTYVTVKANALKEASSRKGCPCRQDLQAHWLCFVASAPVGDKDFKTQKTHLWVCRYPGYPARSKEMFRALAYVGSVLSAGRCPFENCTSCCPSRDTTMVVPTKKKSASTLRSPLHEEDLFTVEHKVGGEMFWQ